ncbi:MAG: baseplate protein J, partial [Deltaproteobacteria bacterium]|nr:baseplate protein J [Deltaproteobacteria bacterium]
MNPMELPDLDDRTFATLLEEARARIPSLVPEWTDHNPTDPGIVLVELLAWLAEMVSYRIDRIPERSSRTFLRLLAGPEANTAAAPLERAIRETLAELRGRERAITMQDFEDVALRRWPDDAALRALGA